MKTNVIRIATRGSLLALTQASQIRDWLIDAGYHADLVPLSTPGDHCDRSVNLIGQGIFTTTLRQALLQGTADLAVHSYKDLPIDQDVQLTIAAVPSREDPRDALVARDGLVLGQLPPGATIGTSSPRRAAQLRALGLGLEILPLRGNLDSRLRKVDHGELDGIVVARAGLARINALEVITEVLNFTQMLPAPAQGALAIECCAKNIELLEILTALDDHNTRVATDAERALLRYLHAGCSAPIGAIAEVVDSIDEDGHLFQELSLRCSVTALDGSDTLRLFDVDAIDHAEQLGQSLAHELCELGADTLMKL